MLCYFWHILERKTAGRQRACFCQKCSINTNSAGLYIYSPTVVYLQVEYYVSFLKLGHLNHVIYAEHELVCWLLERLVSGPGINNMVLGIAEVQP
jgi:hypothetical protein